MATKNLIPDESILSPAVRLGLDYIQFIQTKIARRLLNAVEPDPTKLIAIQNRLSAFRPELIPTIRESNLSLLKALTDILAAISFPNYPDLNSPFPEISSNWRRRLWIRNLRLISTAADSQMFVADLGINKHTLRIEVETDPFKSVAHQRLITKYGTNHLRSTLPNFIYGIGGWEASPPIVDPITSQVVTWGIRSTPNVNYIVWEHLPSTLTMKAFLPTATREQFLNLYLQLLFALRFASSEIDFTHYNLSPEKIFLLSSAPIQILYPTERGPEYLQTELIPILTDFESAHIQTLSPSNIPRSHLGRHGFISKGIFPYRSWILQDAYQILITSYSIASPDVQTTIKVILEYFPPEISDIQLFPGLSIDNLIRHLRGYYHLDFVHPKKFSVPVWNPEASIPESTILSQLGIDLAAPIPIPNTFVDFYEVELRLQRMNLISEKDRLASAFPYSSAASHYLHRLGLQRLAIQTDRRSMNRSNSNILGLIDREAEFDFLYRIGLAIAMSYDDLALVATLKRIEAEFNSVDRPEIDALRANVKETSSDRNKKTQFPQFPILSPELSGMILAALPFVDN